MADKQIVSKPAHGERITAEGGIPSHAMQTHLDDLTQRLNENLLGKALWLPSYTVASVPASADLPNASEAWLIYVTDETGGAIPAFWDGTNWRRVSDRIIVS
jgi:hypothetical protein